MFSCELLKILADGMPHDLEELKSRTMLSEGEVKNSIATFVDCGLTVLSDLDEYRVVGAVELLDGALITSAIGKEAGGMPVDVLVLSCVDSTNNYLLGLARNEPFGEKIHVCLSEMQVGGRGRLGRVWQSPLCANLYMSIGIEFKAGVECLKGLSIAIGLKLAELIESRYGIKKIKVKWPNDLLIDDCKVGGILVDIIGGKDQSSCNAVIGIGLNVNVAPTFIGAEEYESSCLRDFSDVAVSRNILAGEILGIILPLLKSYPDVGFSGLLQTWHEYDAFYKKDVAVFIRGNCEAVGTAVGVNEDGDLLVDVDGVLKRVNSGEVSLRRYG